MSMTKIRRLATYERAVKRFLKKSYRIQQKRLNRGTNHVKNYDKFKSIEERQFFIECQLIKRGEILGLTRFEIDEIWINAKKEITSPD